MPTPIRIGAVSYLNAKPLYYGLCEHAPTSCFRWTFRADLPSNWLPASWTSH